MLDNILRNNYLKLKSIKFCGITFVKLNSRKTKVGFILRSSFKIELNIILRDIIRRVKHGCILWYNFCRISLTTFTNRLGNKTQNCSTTFENITTIVEKDSRIRKELEGNPKIKILPSASLLGLTILPLLPWSIAKNSTPGESSWSSLADTP